MPKYIIFTDLDGTLLDHFTYSFSAASDALKLINGKGIPLIICTSKTRAEILPIRRRLGNRDPFISENGGAIYIPDGYFNLPCEFQRRIRGYKVIEIGSPHEVLLNVLRKVRNETGIKMEGISEMSIQKIMDFTYLKKREAELSKKREYSEPFLTPHINLCAGEILKKGFKFTSGGRFFHIMKGNDKGKAVRMLKKMYKRKYGKITTVGIGNSLNDLPMLKAVDIPVLVRNYDGRYERNIKLKNLYLTDGIGPEGWNKAVRNIISNS